MTVCVRCGEHNAVGTEFCGACGAFLEWEGADATVAEPARTVQPSAMQPAEQRTAAPKHGPGPTRPRAAQPGDLICGQCGSGNAPVRRFCGRCGASLAEVAVVALPWWRRWIPKREPATLKAGARPGRDGVHRRTGLGPAVRGVLRVVRWLVAVLLVVSAALYGLYSPFRQAVNDQALSWKQDVEDVFVTRLAPVRPTAVTATVERPDHPGNLVVDNAFNTYWAAPVDQGEPALVLTFDHPVDLRKAIVRVGVEKEFQSAHRPRSWHLVYSTGKTYDVDLADTPDPQEITLDNGEGSTSVEVHVVALHRSLQGTDVAISEIELFERG
ncbi:zinc ribbon domain-containing protein [Umezawaea endophytica]|uniref:NADase-type glycan-binding domain-containing protein n=1 Tax=Umezawaea endophytica TaxID=1654476 RepID=UPI0035E7046A